MDMSHELFAVFRIIIFPEVEGVKINDKSVWKKNYLVVISTAGDIIILSNNRLLQFRLGTLTNFFHIDFWTDFTISYEKESIVWLGFFLSPQK